MENVLDDYQHRVTNRMKVYADKADFPRVEDFGLSKKQLDDYLFDKQAILDSMGSEKTRYTIYGILIALPVIVASAFPEDQMLGGAQWGLFVNLAIGIVLALLCAALLRLRQQFRLRKLYDDDIEKFIDAVLNYTEQELKN